MVAVKHLDGFSEQTVFLEQEQSYRMKAGTRCIDMKSSAK